MCTVHYFSRNNCTRNYYRIPKYNNNVTISSMKTEQSKLMTLDEK